MRKLTISEVTMHNSLIRNVRIYMLRSTSFRQNYKLEPHNLVNYRKKLDK
jgi:hypothetical protein